MNKFWAKKRKRASLLKFTIFSVLISFTVSCITVDKSSGSDLVPKDQIFKIEVKEFDLPVQMKMSDSLQTLTSGAFVVGAFKDHDLGITTSKAAFRLFPRVDTSGFGVDPKVNYLRLYLEFAAKIILNESDSKIPQNIYIHRLLRDIDSLTIYNNSLSESDYDPTPLNPGGNTYFGGDTLNIELSKRYAEELLTATYEEMDSLALFVKRFKGFVMKTEPMPGSLNGGRFNIIDPTIVSMALSYNHVDDKVTNKDSVIYYFTTNTDFSLNIISHESSHLQTSQPAERVIIEGLAGIKPYIDMGAVRDMINSWAESIDVSLERIAISKAEIILPYEYPDNYKIFSQYPQQLYLATRVVDNTYSGLLHYNLLSEVSFSDDKGIINKSLLTYNLNITSYFQNLLKGKYTKESDLGAYLLPVASTTNGMTGELNYFIDNTVYYKGVINGNNSIRAPKLKIIYAIIP